MEDRELVQRVLKGDKESFGLLVKKYEVKVYSLAFQFTRNAAVADDLAQDIFVKAYRGLAGFKGHSEFGTWLYRIAANHIKDFLRRKPKEVSLDALPVEPAALDDRRDAEKSVEEERQRKVVQQVLQTLPAKHRIVLTLRDIQGLSYEGVARALGVAAGTVDSRLFRARRLLRKKVAAFLETGPERRTP